jgi:hypothetical protein
MKSKTRARRATDVQLREEDIAAQRQRPALRSRDRQPTADEMQQRKQPDNDPRAGSGSLQENLLAALYGFKSPWPVSIPRGLV